MRRLTAFATTLIALGGMGAGGLDAAAPDSDAPTTTPDEAPAIDLDLPLITLLTPALSAAGTVPTFSWESVPGASAYTLAVLTANGEPIWAWQGSSTSVVLGNWVEPPPPDVPGPSITGASTWFVVAVAADGAPLAVSPMRSVAP